MPVLIGIISFLTGDYFIAGKILMVEFSILFLFMSYLLIKKVFNKHVAFFSFLFLATNQHVMTYYTFTINSDLPFAALILISIYFLIRNKDKLNMIYSSIFLSLATLIRVAGLFFIPIFFFRIIFTEINNKTEKSSKNKIKNVFLSLSKYFGIYILLLTPYLILNLIWYGNPIKNNNIENIYQGIRHYTGYYDYPDEISFIDIFFGPETSPYFYLHWINAILAIFHDFLYFLIYNKIPFFPIISEFFNIKFKYTSNTKGHLYAHSPIFLITSIVIFFLVFVGYLVHYKIENKKDKKKFIFSINFFVPLILIIYLFFVSLGWSDLRFILPILPLMLAPLIYLLISIFTIISKLFRRFIKINKKRYNENHTFQMRIKRKSQLLQLILTMYILGQFVVANVIVESKFESEFVEYKIAGEFLKNKITPDDTIYLYNINYLYYLGEPLPKYMKFPYAFDVEGGIPEIILSMKNASYIIISERIEVHHKQYLKFLLNPQDESIPDFLEPIFIYNVTNREIVIYQVVEI